MLFKKTDTCTALISDKQDRKRGEREPSLPMHQLSPVAILSHQSFLLQTLWFSAFPPGKKTVSTSEGWKSICKWSGTGDCAMIKWEAPSNCWEPRWKSSDHRQSNRVWSLIILQPDEKYELRSKILRGFLSLGLQDEQHPSRSSSGLYLTASFQRAPHTRDTQVEKVEMWVKYQEVERLTFIWEYF